MRTPAEDHARMGPMPGAAPSAGGSPGDGKAALSQALVPVAAEIETEDESSAFPPAVLRLPVELDVAVPVRNFRVRNLLAMQPGTVIESQWGHGSDVPLAAGKVVLAWSEFEVLELALAVRVTRLG